MGPEEFCVIQKLCRNGKVRHSPQEIIPSRKMTERKAFDTKVYHANKIGLAPDLSALAIESSQNLRFRDKIFPFVLQTTHDGKVINPALGNKDVLNYYTDSTVLDQAESTAGMKIREALLSEPVGSISVWLSPPGGPLNYTEGRMVVGCKHCTDNDQYYLESYGICLPLSQIEFHNIASELAKHSYNAKDNPVSYENLRSEIFLLQHDGYPWDYLARIAPIESVWKNIRSGKALEVKNKALEDARTVAEYVFPLLEKAVTQNDFIRAGAIAENMMRTKGWQIGSGPCGTINIDLMKNEMQNFLKIELDISDFKGNFQKTEIYKFVHKCGNCGQEINKKIKTGFLCSNCGKPYLGC